jgi:hypothetical protein
MVGQDSIGRFSVTLAPDVYLPSTSQRNEGALQPKFLPSYAGHLEVTWKFWNVKNRSWHLYYRFGITTWRISNQLRPDQLPILRNTIDSRYWGRSRYHAGGFNCKFHFTNGGELSIGAGNRFYVSMHGGFSITSVRANTQTRLLVFRTDVNAPAIYFNPEINMAYMRPLFRKWPAFKAALSLSVAPRNVFEAEYVYFPDDAQYKSSGTMRLMQSYLSIGLCYQRILREE